MNSTKKCMNSTVGSTIFLANAKKFHPSAIKTHAKSLIQSQKEKFPNQSQGENSQIPHFGKICGKLALFWKYLTIYHFFSTRFPR